MKELRHASLLCCRAEVVVAALSRLLPMTKWLYMAKTLTIVQHCVASFTCFSFYTPYPLTSKGDYALKHSLCATSNSSTKTNHSPALYPKALVILFQSGHRSQKRGRGVSLLQQLLSPAPLDPAHSTNLFTSEMLLMPSWCLLLQARVMAHLFFR